MSIHPDAKSRAVNPGKIAAISACVSSSSRSLKPYAPASARLPVLVEKSNKPGLLTTVTFIASKHFSATARSSTMRPIWEKVLRELGAKVQFAAF